MNKSQPTPPAFFQKFFRWYCHPKLKNHIEGDLFEVYGERFEHSGKRKADFAYILEVLLLFRPGIIRPVEGYKHLNQYGMFKTHFKIGWRNLLKNKGFAFINIGGLSVGMAVAMLIALWMYDELSFNQNFANHDRIAQVIQNTANNDEIQTWTSVPFPLGEELRKNFGGDFKHVTMASQNSYAILSFEEKTFTKSGFYFEPEALDMFSLEMVSGTHNGLSDPSSILLSESTARAYFGDADPMDKIMKLDNSLDVKVTGIYKDFPFNSTFARLNFIAPWQLFYNSAGLKNRTNPWRCNCYSSYVEIEDQAGMEQISEKIKDVKLKNVREDEKIHKAQLFLHPMSQWHLYSKFKNGVNNGGRIQYVRLFAMIGIFVLLLACINFMNLTTARSEKRAREVGIRKAIGSLRGQLIYQFLVESFLVVVFAFVLSIAIVQLCLPFFNEVASKQMHILWGEPLFWAAGAGFSLLTGLLAGSYPSLFLSSFIPVQALKGTFKTGRSASVPRKVLVTLQFTVSVMLIIGTMVVFSQIQFTKNRPIGYSREGLVAIPMVTNEIHNHFDVVKNELVQAGAITMMAEAGSSITDVWATNSGFNWKGKDPAQALDFPNTDVSWDYGKTVGWHFVAGRDFSREFPSDTAAFVLNESAAKFIGFKDPIGEVITWDDRPYTVIGIIQDVVVESPYKPVRPSVYHLTLDGSNMAMLRINPQVSAAEAMEKIETVFTKNNPSQPFDFEWVDKEYAKKFDGEARVGKLSGFFAGLAIFISCLGLFGMASFVAEQRTKEMGIRKVLGASVSSLWKMLSKDFVILVMIACLIAIPLSWYLMNHWLEQYEYRTTVSWYIFASAAAGALVITILTVSYQAVKAAMSNPVYSLKTE